MARIVIVTSVGMHVARLIQVAEELRSRGHTVVLGMERQAPEVVLPCVISVDEYAGSKPRMDFRKKRDYPTLREGLRRNLVKKLRR
jgi:UDP:flavonoid glycosyltransferase YjiC (YdhE family)